MISIRCPGKNVPRARYDVVRHKTYRWFTIYQKKTDLKNVRRHEYLSFFTTRLVKLRHSLLLSYEIGVIFDVNQRSGVRTSRLIGEGVYPDQRLRQ